MATTYPPINGISTSAVALRLPSTAKENQFIENIGVVTVYLGGATVTTATGLPFTPGSRVQVMDNSSAIYAIAAAGATGSVSVGYGLYP